ncbi:hypothetical protein LCGC14_3001800, partial [marine sediment metagenome]
TRENELWPKRRLEELKKVLGDNV